MVVTATAAESISPTMTLVAGFGDDCDWAVGSCWPWLGRCRYDLSCGCSAVWLAGVMNW